MPIVTNLGNLGPEQLVLLESRDFINPTTVLKIYLFFFNLFFCFCVSVYTHRNKGVPGAQFMTSNALPKLRTRILYQGLWKISE